MTKTLTANGMTELQWVRNKQNAIMLWSGHGYCYSYHFWCDHGPL